MKEITVDGVTYVEKEVKEKWEYLDSSGVWESMHAPNERETSCIKKISSGSGEDSKYDYFVEDNTYNIWIWRKKNEDK